MKTAIRSGLQSRAQSTFGLAVFALAFCVGLGIAGQARAAAPTVTAVSSTTVAGSYNAGDAIDITLTFSEAVTVTGSPRIQISTGNGTKYTTYSTGSTTTALHFAYTVVAGDNINPLVLFSTSALSLNGGTIKNVGTEDAVLTLPAVVLGRTIILDTTVATLSDGQISYNSSSADPKEVTLWVYTDETATCKYSTSASTAYASMTSTFTNTASTIHSTTLTNMWSGVLYTYYIRCSDVATNPNVSDYSVSFTLQNSGDSGTASSATIAPASTNNSNAAVSSASNSYTPLLDAGSGATSLASQLVFTTRSKTVVFQGSQAAVAGGTVKIYRGKKLIRTVTVDGNGNWATIVRANKKYTYKFVYLDASGQIVNESSYQIRIQKH